MNPPRIGVVHSRFNEEICNALLESARAELARSGTEAEFVSVAGALEIPLALQWMAQSGRFDALVAVGAVIRGDTYHFEIVCNESARGVMDVALQFGVAGGQRHPHHGGRGAGAGAQGQGRRSGARRGRDGAPQARAGGKMALKPAGRTTARRRAREIALQALYAWKLAGGDAHEHAHTLEGWDRCDQPFAAELIAQVVGRNEALEKCIAPHLDRSLASLSPVERVILLIGAYELSARPETPFKVVLNEAIELGKSYGGTDGHKFVNGVLEKLAREFRPEEFARVRQAL